MLAKEVEWSFVSPSYSRDSLDAIEVPVVRKNAGFVLLCLSRDPNVVPWNRRATGFELAPDCRVESGRGCIQSHHGEPLLQFLQLGFIGSPITRGQEAESVFPEHNRRKQQVRRFGQRSGDANVSIKPSRKRIRIDHYLH